MKKLEFNVSIRVILVLSYLIIGYAKRRITGIRYKNGIIEYVSSPAYNETTRAHDTVMLPMHKSNNMPIYRKRYLTSYFSNSGKLLI